MHIARLTRPGIGDVLFVPLRPKASGFVRYEVTAQLEDGTNRNTVILVLHGCSLGCASFWLEEA